MWRRDHERYVPSHHTVATRAQGELGPAAGAAVGVRREAEGPPGVVLASDREMLVEGNALVLGCRQLLWQLRSQRKESAPREDEFVRG